MLELSKQQEREERQAMGQGMLVSVFGLLFCWLPAVGLIVALTGFWKVVKCVTRRYRARHTLYAAASFLIFVIATGALLGEVYLYVQNPNVIQDTGRWAYQKITGESALPGEDQTAPADGSGVDYDETGAQGMGLDTSIYGYEGDDVWGYDPETDTASDSNDAYVPDGE